ncbi:MAG: glycosyltransferase [Vicinamibacterales bacterium]
MRVVLTCWGSYGDLFPYLGLARELKRRGHIPAVATALCYRALVEGEGVEFHPVRPDIDPDDFALIRRLMDPARGIQVILRELLVPAVRDAFDDLQRAARGADLLVTHPVTFAGPIVADLLRLPWVSTVLAPVSFFSIHDFPALPVMPLAIHRQLRRLGPPPARLLLGLAKRMTRPWMEPVVELRKELGLSPSGDPLYEGQFSPRLTLALFSRLLGEPQPDWPPNAEVTGFVFYNGALRMPPELLDFLERGDPPIVFTLGSSAVGAAGDFFRESAGAAASLGARAVLLVGRDPGKQPQGALPTGVIAVESAPHEQLLPRAAAIVHQGGVGTTGQALKSGRPMLVVPHAHDQPDNAFRVMKLGVARVLKPGRYTASRAAAQLRALLTDPAYARRASEIGVHVHAENGTERAVAALEACGDSAVRPRLSAGEA